MKMPRTRSKSAESTRKPPYPFPGVLKRSRSRPKPLRSLPASVLEEYKLNCPVPSPNPQTSAVASGTDRDFQPPNPNLPLSPPQSLRSNSAGFGSPCFIQRCPKYAALYRGKNWHAYFHIRQLSSTKGIQLVSSEKIGQLYVRRHGCQQQRALAQNLRPKLICPVPQREIDILRQLGKSGFVPKLVDVVGRDNYVTSYYVELANGGDLYHYFRRSDVPDLAKVALLWYVSVEIMTIFAYLHQGLEEVPGLDDEISESDYNVDTTLLTTTSEDGLELNGCCSTGHAASGLRSGDRSWSPILHGDATSRNVLLHFSEDGRSPRVMLDNFRHSILGWDTLSALGEKEDLETMINSLLLLAGTLSQRDYDTVTWLCDLRTAVRRNLMASAIVCHPTFTKCRMKAALMMAKSVNMSFPGPLFPRLPYFFQTMDPPDGSVDAEILDVLPEPFEWAKISYAGDYWRYQLSDAQVSPKRKSPRRAGSVLSDILMRDVSPKLPSAE